MRFVGYETALPQAPGARSRRRAFRNRQHRAIRRGRAMDRQRAGVMCVVDPAAADAMALRTASRWSRGIVMFSAANSCASRGNACHRMTTRARRRDTRIHAGRSAHGAGRGGGAGGRRHSACGARTCCGYAAPMPRRRCSRCRPRRTDTSASHARYADAAQLARQPPEGLGLRTTVRAWLLRHQPAHQRRWSGLLGHRARRSRAPARRRHALRRIRASTRHRPARGRRRRRRSQRGLLAINRSRLAGQRPGQDGCTQRDEGKHHGAAIRYRALTRWPRVKSEPHIAHSVAGAREPSKARSRT